MVGENIEGIDVGEENDDDNERRTLLEGIESLTDEVDDEDGLLSEIKEEVDGIGDGAEEEVEEVTEPIEKKVGEKSDDVRQATDVSDLGENVEQVIQELVSDEAADTSDIVEKLDEVQQKLLESLAEISDEDAAAEILKEVDSPLIEGIAVEPENPSDEIGQEFQLDLPDQSSDVDVDAPDVDVDVDLSKVVQEIKVTNQLLQALNQTIQSSSNVVANQVAQARSDRLTRNERIRDETTQAGSNEAAELEIGDFRSDFEVYYDLDNTNHSIIVEVSGDGNNWKRFAQVGFPNNQTSDVLQGETTYTHVRAYPSDNYSDTEVSLLEISSKGS